MDTADGSKGNSRIKVRRENDEICERRGRVVPVPPVAVPVQVLDVQVAVRVAESCAVPSAPPPFDFSRG